MPCGAAASVVLTGPHCRSYQRITHNADRAKLCHSAGGCQAIHRSSICPRVEAECSRTCIQKGAPRDPPTARDASARRPSYGAKRRSPGSAATLPACAGRTAPTARSFDCLLRTSLRIRAITSGFSRRCADPTRPDHHTVAVALSNRRPGASGASAYDRARGRVCDRRNASARSVVVPGCV
jgi:hypothetical protein